MPKAIVDPEKCRPSQCPGGICFVRKSCPTKAIFQMEPEELPATDPLRCHGCSKCVAYCPLKAIVLV